MTCIPTSAMPNQLTLRGLSVLVHDDTSRSCTDWNRCSLYHGCDWSPILGKVVLSTVGVTSSYELLAHEMSAQLNDIHVAWRAIQHTCLAF